MLIVLYTIIPHVWSRASFLVNALGPQNPVGGPAATQELVIGMLQF